jgi:hypothetical protein
MQTRTLLQRSPLLCLPLALALGCRSSESPASPASDRPAAARESADAERLHADVAWLADDAREGRRAGTQGALEAAQWIAERMAELGLEPAGEGGGFFQRFEVPLPAVDGGGSYVRAGKSESRAVAPLFCSEGGSAQGRYAFCGYGIVSAAHGWDDLAEHDLQGAIAVVLRGTPQTAPPVSGEHGTENVEPAAGWGNAGSIFAKVMAAKRKGAVGVVMVQSLAEPDQAPTRFDTTQSARAGIPAVLVPGRLLGELFAGDQAGLEQRLEERAPHGLVAREPELELHADVRRERGPAVNVLGRLKGRAAARTLVVGAHYDHLGRGGDGSLAPGSTGEIHNGADDNASGTAAVLEMARLLAAGAEPAGDVVFALWSGEELGLLGSEHWAQDPTLPLEHVRANLNLDMVGRAGDGHLEVLGAGTAEPFADWLAEAGPRAGLDLKVSASGQGMGGSDHHTFLKREVPALHFFSGVHPDYHKPSDDTERFEADGARRVCALGLDLIERMQAAPELAWVAPPAPAADARAGAAATSGFRVWFGSVPEYSFKGPGLLLAGTSAGSPAEKAGLLAGDVVTQLGDVKVETIYDFMYALSVYKPGDVVVARYLRDGEPESVRVTLATRAAE